MKEYVEGLVRKYRGAGIIVDSNLLLLYFIGLVDLQQIKTFSRTKNFVVEDYQALVDILKNFSKIVTTPNILTEVSNFLGQLKTNQSPYFTAFMNGVAKLDEHCLSSLEISKMQGFTWLHLTDSGIVHLAKDKYLVITIDAPLANYLSGKGIEVINFNNIRTAYWK